MKNSVVFMGSPDFALPVLIALAERYEIRGIVTQPDRPAGRGKLLVAPPVKREAEKLGLPVIQPQKLRDPSSMDILNQWAPEVIIVAAYGQILRQEVLDLPRHGCINVHASLLPRWRGASPIQAAILAGDDQTGITIIKMDAGLDSGPILSQKSIQIEGEDTAGSLSEKLSKLGAVLLLDTLPDYLSGRITPKEQNEDLVTKAPLLTKQLGELDLKHDAIYLARQVRAYHPWPGCYVSFQGQILKILRAHASSNISTIPGQRLVVESKPAFGCAMGALILDEVQPSGRRSMSGEEYLRGNRRWRD